LTGVKTQGLLAARVRPGHIGSGSRLSTAEYASPITTGTILAGKYRVEKLIGQGGMGVVVEARHTTLDDRVALKFLLPEYAAHPEASQRFLREARAAVKIKSPHVARVSDVGTLEDGAPYMVMEFLEGRDASQLLSSGTPMSIPDAVDLVVQACDAIAEAHAQGIVHRDLKPANLFVTRHGDGSPFVKVLDFGISKMSNDTGSPDGLTRTSATMGSALYMSPEQIRSSKSVDHRTDIYALGVTLYELLCGRQPFLADSFAALCVEIATGIPAPLRDIRPDVSPELARAIEKAYARDLAERYQSIAELVVGLAPWVPPRSQPIVERIARAGGLAGAPDRGSYADLGGSSPGAGAPAGARTNLDGTTTVPPRTKSPLGAIAVGGVLLLVIGGAAVVGGTLLMKRGQTAGADPAASASAAPGAAALPADPPKLEAPPEAPKVEPMAEPTPTSEADAGSTKPEAKPVAKGTAVAKVAPKPEPKAEPKPEPPKTASTAPPPPPKKAADAVR